MAATITIEKNATAPFESKNDQSWEELGQILGYPDSWIRAIRSDLNNAGKDIEWKQLPSKDIAP